MNRKIIIGIICFSIVACLAVGIGLNNKGSNSEEKTVSVSNQETKSAIADENTSFITEEKTEAVSVSEENSSTDKATEKASSTSKKAETKTTERVTKKKNEAKPPKKAPEKSSSKKVTEARPPVKTTKNQKISVSFSINCEKAAEYGADYLKYLIGKTKCEVKDGTTVFDLLSEECRKNGIAVVHQNKSYVKAIGGLAEKDCGNGSGWTYKVNGVKPMMSASKYVLKNGDVVEWYYVTSPTD